MICERFIVIMILHRIFVQWKEFRSKMNCHKHLKEHAICWEYYDVINIQAMVGILLKCWRTFGCYKINFAFVINVTKLSLAWVMLARGRSRLNTGKKKKGQIEEEHATLRIELYASIIMLLVCCSWSLFDRFRRLRASCFWEVDNRKSKLNRMIFSPIAWKISETT